MRKVFLWAVFVLLAASEASASMCTSQPGNQAGDIMQTYIDYWDQGQGGIHWELYIDGITWQEYGATPLWGADNSCLHQCTNIRFTAKVPNVYIHNEVSGSTGGWKCSIVAQVVGHDNSFVRTPIPQRKKDVALENANFYRSGRQFFQGIQAGCLVLSVPKNVCSMATVVVTYLQNAETEQRKINTDPWDDYYYVPYEGYWPSLESIGFTEAIDDRYQAGLAYNAQEIVSLGDFIYVSANRASSCDMAGADCGGWQADRAAWGVRELGYRLDDAASNLWVIAWEMEQIGAATDIVSSLRDLASISSWAGSELSQ